MIGKYFKPARYLKSTERLYKNFAHSSDMIFVRYFVVISSIVGLIFVFLTPPLQGADEIGHLFRAYQVSTNNLVSDYSSNGVGGIFYNSLRSGKKPRTVVGGQIPVGLVALARTSSERLPQHPAQKIYRADFQKMAAIPWSNKTASINFFGAATYSPVAYAPHVIGVWLARLFNLRPLYMMYLMRLTALLFGIIIIAFAIYIMPFAKLPFTLLALWPMSLFQLSTITADTTAIALSFLFISLVAHLINKKSDLSYKKMSGLVLVAGSMVLTKPTLFLLVFLTLGFLTNKSITLKKASIAIASTIVISLALVFTWNSLVKDMISYGFTQTFPGNSYSSQLESIKTKPLYFGYVLYESILTGNFDKEVGSAVANLGWMDTPFPMVGVVCAYMLLAIGVFVASQADSPKFSKWFRAQLIATSALIVLATLTALYLFQTPVGYYTVLGVQGRYMIPAVALIILALSQGNKTFSSGRYSHLAQTSLRISAALLVWMIFIEAIRFYPISVIMRRHLNF